jgi:hypothetical protein
MARAQEGGNVIVLESADASAFLRFTDVYRRMQGGALLLACRALLALGISLGRLGRGGRLHHRRARFGPLRRGGRGLARRRHILRATQARLPKGRRGQRQGT